MVRDPRASEVAEVDAAPWSTRSLHGHSYCLLTSFRRSGESVSTPVWFGTGGDRIYIRSGAQDGKIKRMRRNLDVLITPCGARGRPLGRPMAATARILSPGEEPHAEAVLRASYGIGRRVYRVVRRRISVLYLEVSARGSGDGALAA